MPLSTLINGLSAEGVAVDLVPITPSDEADLATACRAIRCRPDGADGTLRITTLSGSVRNTRITAGEVLQVATVRVHATGTSATNLEAML